MLVRAKMHWPGLVIVALLLVSCTGDGRTDPNTDGRSQSGDGTSAQSPEKSPGSRLVACVDEEAHVKSTDVPTDNALTVGAISWPDLKSWATADPKDYGNGESGDYKIGALVKAGAVVTVSVADSNANDVGLKYGQRWNYEPTRSVTFQGCKDYDTAYIGGFHIPDQKCVPFDISEGGKPPVRVTVSFFAGPC
ncbi:hypothetical protein [Actinoplanes auranticolor]|uniref:Uncharacterized protein n=1 Tax=Actinoplanes auranticolor TaxID=47988 RepID=A0A919SUP8_9ACTN|nr:hypothetical protein [Actinoplanes auranticolor]GIM77959.1 hypothetical protein Aau02nite_78500 [Actinoplanes auranticolor]